ncbi:MAG: hypothetical protein ACTSUO_00770 [Candidatus Thorarchaeota archaeon]
MTFFKETHVGIIESVEILLKRVYETYSKEAKQDEALWNVLTALRGPDEITIDEKTFDISLKNQLKEFTVARIRAIIGISPNAPFWVRHSPLHDDEILMRNKLLRKCNEHFKDHFIAAMRTLKDLGYKIPEKELNFVTTTKEELQ